MADKGYQGLQKLYPNSCIPQKKPRKAELSSEAKKENRELVSKRVIGEYVSRHLKIFKILAERYRSRRKRFGLSFNLLAGLYNYELRLTKLNQLNGLLQEVY